MSALHKRGFAITAIAILALGIGLSTAVFTVADALWIHRLPVRNQDRIVVLWSETRKGEFSNYPLLLDDERRFALASRTLSVVAFYSYEGAIPRVIADNGRTYRLRRALVSGNYFDALGSRAQIGRALRSDDDLPGAAPVMVISHAAWLDRFAGDSGVVGRSVSMVESGRRFTIVGVMPQGLEFPQGTDIWAPLVASSIGSGLDSMHLTSPCLDVVGRLAARATAADARAEFDRFDGDALVPRFHLVLHGVVHTLPDLVLGQAKPVLLLVVAAAGLLLLVACVNVANLLLVRGLARTRELTVRAALGASRARIAGMLLAESAMLAVIGGVIGTVLGIVSVRLFVALAPPDMPRLDEISVNGSALAGAVALTSAALLLFGLAPAFMTSRVDGQDVLRSGSRHSGGRGIRTITQSLVAVQMALAVLLLSGAALVSRSLVNLERIDLAFRPTHLTVAQLAAAQNGGPSANVFALIQDLTARVAALPGVAGAAPVLSQPFGGTGAGVTGRMRAPGQSDAQRGENPMLNFEVVTPNYFDVLGIPILRGRPFSDTDRAGAPAVIIVSQSTAAYYWPNEDPIGKRLDKYTVVGVVPETHYRELRAPRPNVYFPVRQSPFGDWLPTLIVRSSRTPSELVPALRQAVGGSDSRLTLVSTTSLDQLLDAQRAQPRLDAMLLGVFALATIALAAIGLFAVMAMLVRQRTRELGIRMALGATPASVWQLVMQRGLAIAVAGVPVGIGAALLSGKVLNAMLFELKPTDPRTLGGVVLGVMLVAALSSWLPARVSAAIDPAISLRNDE